MLVLHRPASIEASSRSALDAEYQAALWTHHRLLDFEDQHQAVLDAAAERVAPGITRVGRILTRLARRARRADRASKGTWSPNPRPDLAARLRVLLDDLRRARNASDEWRVALGWADEQVGEPKAVRRRKAKPASKVQRRKGESDEAWQKRFALVTTDESDEHYAAKLANPPRDTRRDEHRKQLYADLRIYWGTWNGLLASVDKARSAVLAQRKQGLPAEWRRPRWRNGNTLHVERGGIRVVERGQLWWTLEMRIGTHGRWARIQAKCGNWHEVRNDVIVGAKLTRWRDGERWQYSVSLTVDAHKDLSGLADAGSVAFDWGHREHGHDSATQGMRVFAWLGDDGARGEVLLPRECRTALDEIDAMKARLDETFNARKKSLVLPDHNRHGYRRRLMTSGVRTEEQSGWLRWEMRYERRIAKRRKRIENLRRETYLQAVRTLRKQYHTFMFEDEKAWSLRKLAKDEMSTRRKRSNRDVSARYEFVQICERFGAALITVTARNSTRECPDCGFVGENGPELLYACPGCGVARDKDRGAARVILARGQAALADQGASA